MKAPAIADIGRALRRHPALALLLVAAVCIALLLLLRGATRPYTNTVRVVGYSNAATLWMLIPGVGSLVSTSSPQPRVWSACIVDGAFIGS